MAYDRANTISGSRLDSLKKAPARFQTRPNIRLWSWQGNASSRTSPPRRGRPNFMKLSAVWPPASGEPFACRIRRCVPPPPSQRAVRPCFADCGQPHGDNSPDDRARSVKCEEQESGWPKLPNRIRAEEGLPEGVWIKCLERRQPFPDHSKVDREAQKRPGPHAGKTHLWSSKNSTVKPTADRCFVEHVQSTLTW